MFQGALFTRDWLKQGVTESPEWQNLEISEVEQLYESAQHLLHEHSGHKKPTEAETEDQLIYPLLELLGWQHKSVQQNMTTTAEGVETAEEAAMIRDMGCTKIQGYHFGRPMPSEDARAVFSRAEAIRSA